MRIPTQQFLFHFAAKLRRYVPATVKQLLRKNWSFLEYDRETWRASIQQKISKRPEPAPTRHQNLKIGILSDYTYYYLYHVAACEDLGVPYEVIDVGASDWLEKVRRSGCLAYLAWPSPALSIWRDMCEERVKILERELGALVCPSYDELWLYENKRRVRDWLEAHSIPHPQTWVFFDLEEALSFADRCDYPVVLKSNFGSSSNGVFILRSACQARRAIKGAFKKGLHTRRGDPRDRQWGHVILQEFIEHDHEWRIVRLGDSFFCRKKTRVGDFASGSGAVDWAKPEEALLEFAKYVTDVGHFTSMSIDIFEDAGGDKGRYLVNELHAVFGIGTVNSTQTGNDALGRYKCIEGKWVFEPGFFYQNVGANERVKYVIRTLKQRRSR